MSILQRMVDVAKGKIPVGMPRSSKWPSVRAAHLATHPTCEVCGGTASLEVHHMLPFHLFPNGELDPSNLVTLCEANKNGVNCHLFIGHLGNFKSYNRAVQMDAALWLSKLATRPKS